MNILLVSPQTPATFWSYKHALKFISKRSTEPPLGLLTLAAMLPDSWNLKLIDLNVEPLRDKDLAEADYLFLTGMIVHRRSMLQVIERARRHGVPVVCGGPLATIDWNMLPGADVFVQGEAEEAISPFLEDLQNGRPLKKFYRAQRFPDIQTTPVPRWNLLNMKHYASMSVQFSRGCPYNCEFCNVTVLNGHRPRTKSAEQFVNELQALYDAGWRGSVFVVDDNFIGNRKVLKQRVLPAIARWMQEHNHPFSFGTEVSINLANDPELMRLMVEAGFDTVFVGIETVNQASLEECNKKQNIKTDLQRAVRTIQQHGLMVTGGFIIGFDHDPPNIFEQQFRFIQTTGIVTAMVGLLNAPTGTRLYERLKKEKRLIASLSGDNMDGSTNILPKMDINYLKRKYRILINSLYESRTFYQRLKVFLTNYVPPPAHHFSVTVAELKALFRSLWVLGVKERGRWHYWKVLFYSLVRFPSKFPLAVRLSIYGYHFRRVARQASGN